MGRVVKLYPDSVGVVRIVHVKSSTGVLKRPISKLCVIVKADRKEKPDDEILPAEILDDAPTDAATLNATAGEDAAR